jgi:hypothetical protein
MTRTLRFLIVPVLLSVATVTTGQDLAEPFRYTVVLAPSAPDLSPKPLFAAVHELAPGSEFSLDAGKQLLRLSSTRELSEEELTTAIKRSGFEVVLLRMPGQAVPGSTKDDPWEDFPVFIDTGDPEVDHATYATAKAAWVQANLDAYLKVVPRRHPLPQGDDE